MWYGWFMPDAADFTTVELRPLRSRPLPVAVSADDGQVLRVDEESDGTFSLSWGLPAGTSTAVGDLTELTDSTGQTPDDTIANVAAITVAAHTALALTDTQIDDTPDAAAVNTAINAAITDAVSKVKTGVDNALAVVEANLSDLTAKVNEIIGAS